MYNVIRNIVTIVSTLERVVFMRKRIISIIIAILIVVSAIDFRSEAANGVWKYSDGGWWYEFFDGSYAHNEYIDGYWLNSAGWYDSAWNGSWKHDSGGWWFQSGSWYPCDQWLKIDGGWYYFKSNGYMAANEWIGNYYLKDCGIMAQDEWIGDYYVGLDGAWVKDRKKNNDTNNSNSASNSGSTNNNTSSNNKSNTGSGGNVNCSHKNSKMVYEDLETGKTKTTEKVYDVCTLCGYIAPRKYYSGEESGWYRWSEKYEHKHTDGTGIGSSQPVQLETGWTKYISYYCNDCKEYYSKTCDYKWDCSQYDEIKDPLHLGVSDGYHHWVEYGSGEICVVCGARRGYPKQTDKQSILE